MTTHLTEKGIGFGLIFFASSEAPHDKDKYRLVMESAKIADRYGFSSIWIPERHFTKDGWLYPNPAVLQAAIARETRQINLRAGSVVLPLHNPIRVAEEWAMVDNLSNGRIGVSFASGWHPNDFALFPENYDKRNEEMYRGIETVRKLWRGESIQVKGGDGNLIAIKTFPPPIQPELPFWLTAAGNPKTFAGAGEIGANLLTHMYNQSVDELADKIRIYREGRAKGGFDPATGQVSVMLHTFVGASDETVRALAEDPFCNYLRSASYLLNAIAYSRGQKVDLSSLSEQDVEEYLKFVFERLISMQRVLFGTPESCFNLVKQLKQAGVNEIACQLDFGLDVDVALDSMQYLNQLKELCDAELVAPASTADWGASLNLSTTPSPTTDISNGNAHSSSNGATKNAVSSHTSNRLEDVRTRCSEEVSVTDFYDRLSSHGIQLADSFRGITQLHRHDGEALGCVRLSASLEQAAASYQLHPALLDACLQVLIATLPASLVSGDALYLPTAVRSFRMHAQPGSQVWSHAVLTAGLAQSDTALEGDVRILTEDGQLLVEAKGIQLQRTELAATSPVQHEELADWLYELRWEQQAASIERHLSVSGSGKWLIFMDGVGVGRYLVELLTAQGETCLTVVPGYSYQQIAQGEYRVNPDRPADVLRLIKEVTAADKLPFRGVIHLWSLDTTPTATTNLASLEDDQALSAGNALSVIQGLINIQDTDLPRLWLVSRGAQPVTTEQTELAVAQSPLWGLGRTCAMEHSEFWGGLIDTDAQSSVQDTAAQLLETITRESHEDQIAFRAGQRYVARMVRSRALPSRSLQLSSSAAYLITGGLWGLGLEVARWLVQKRARHLVLLGRTQLPARSEWNHVEPGTRVAQQVAGVRMLENLGARVYYGSVDVTNEQQLVSFLQDYNRQGHPPIKGVIHAASVWQDHQGQSLVRPLANLDAVALREVFRPKVLGSWLLHSLFKDATLDFFVSFSSGASLFGSAAQGNYAAAGAFLDALAHYQRSHNQPALSIDWGAVSKIGFGATPEGLRVHEYWESHGIQRFSPAGVLAALDLLIPQDVAQMGVLKLDWRLLREFFPQISSLPLVQYLLDEVPVESSFSLSTSYGESDVVRAVLDAGEGERLPVLQAYLSEMVAAVLRVPRAKLDAEQPLTTLGLDSLMAIELKNRIELELNVRIPIVTFLQGPSIAQFSAQVLDQLLSGSLATAAVAATTTATAVAQSHEENGNGALARHDDAAHLLTQLDQLSDAQVDSLLDQMLHEQNSSGTESTALDAQDAEQLLAQLDQLPDETIDSLLNQIVREEGRN